MGRTEATAGRESPQPACTSYEALPRPASGHPCGTTCHTNVLDRHFRVQRDCFHLASGRVGAGADVTCLEIIVSDDGPTDGLEQALEPYGHGVRLVQGPHGGLAVARNRGYRAASGEFVANLDADDVFDSEFLEAVGELASARPDLDILHDRLVSRPRGDSPSSLLRRRLGLLYG